MASLMSFTRGSRVVVGVEIERWAGCYRWVTEWSSVPSGAGRLDQLDQDAPGVLGVDEVDPAAGRAAPGDVVEQPEAALAQRGADRLDIGHPEGELLQPCPGPPDELGDRGLGGQRGEQLDAGLPVADGEHRLADTLFLVGLLVHRVHAEGLRVEGDRLVEIRDGDAHMVDGGEQLCGKTRGPR